MTRVDEPTVPAVKALHIGISLVKSIGGQGESVRHFCEALGGSVVSFTYQDKIRQEPSYIVDTTHVPVPQGGITGLAMKPPESALRTAENAVQESNLLIVNLLYRYHVHWAYRMARRYKLPLWIVVHGALDPYVLSYRTLQKKLWLTLWGKSYLKNADRVIFATEREREKAAPVHEGSNSRVISWPVAMADIAKAPEARARLVDRFGVPSGKRTLLFFGRYEKMKRPLETIQAFADARCSHTVLVLAGIEEDYRVGQLQGHALRLGVDDRVRVAGPIYGDEKEMLLLGSDGFISLSWRENFGYTTAEAMAAGSAVILSPGNDLRSLMGSIDCGWMLSDFDVGSATEAIRDFDTAGPELLAEKGATAHAWAERSLRFATFGQALLNEWRDCYLSRHRATTWAREA